MESSGLPGLDAIAETTVRAALPGRDDPLLRALAADVKARYGREWARYFESIGRSRMAVLPPVPDGLVSPRCFASARHFAEWLHALRFTPTSRADVCQDCSPEYHAVQHAMGACDEYQRVFFLASVRSGECTGLLPEHISLTLEMQLPRAERVRLEAVRKADAKAGKVIANASSQQSARAKRGGGDGYD